MPERRYSEDEVQRILAAAAEHDAGLVPSADAERGLTLPELQQVATEAGLSPTAVANAAAALDRPAAPVSDVRLLGLRASVSHSVSLARPLTDAEWRRLVTLLRDTFEAYGREEQVSGRREWRNGNLRVVVESVGGETFLDLRTQKESARVYARTGLALLGGSGVLATALVASHASAHALTGPLILGLAGIAFNAASALQLTTWRPVRRKQFETIAEYARRLTSGEVGTDRP